MADIINIGCNFHRISESGVEWKCEGWGKGGGGGDGGVKVREGGGGVGDGSVKVREGGATIHRVGRDGGVKVGEGGGGKPSTEIFHKGNFSLSRI